MLATSALLAMSVGALSTNAMLEMDAEASMESDTMMQNKMMTTTMMSTDVEVVASAAFLADMDVIESRDSSAEYNLDAEITRREMLKVMMNMSGKTVLDTCDGEFDDMDSSDWGCKYAEAALANGFIAANASFRPNDSISQAESLKMVMQARGIERDENDDWKAGYESKAMSQWVISSSLNLNANAKRGMIFNIGARTYSNFEAMEDTSGNSVMGVEVGGEMMVDTKNIVENASASSDHTTLVAAVQAAGLVDTLSSEGPFTVFAPTNNAFEMLPEGTVSTLLMTENKGMLTDILTYHVVAGSYMASDITDGLTLTTVNGAELMFSIVEGIVYINGEATVTIADAKASNGVVHVIDTVLMPSDDEMMDDDM